MVDQIMSTKTSRKPTNIPTDFTEPLVIFLKDQVMLLWAKTTEEQTLWRRELRKLLDPKDQVKVDRASVLEESK